VGRLAIRKVEYFGDLYSFTSPDLPDGLVIVEGSNGSGKTTFADLIFFALGGTVKQFAKKGTAAQHKEIRADSNNGVRLTIEINGQLFTVTRRFDTASDALVASHATERVEVLPVVRRDNRRILSDWLLETLGIHVVTLFLGTYKGMLNFADVMRLIYHDQDPDPSRVFKKLDSDNFVSDSKDFRRAIFEILIGKASETYYEVLGELRLAQTAATERQAALDAYRSAVERARRAASKDEDVNAEFLKQEIADREKQLERLEQTRKQLRQTSPNAPAGETALLELRQALASAEERLVEAEQRANAVRAEKIRLRSLDDQLVDEVERIQKIIHAHETLALFSPDTCPCCLRKVDRAQNKCICGQAIDESAYQRFFYSSEEYVGILKSKQKNAETVRAAVAACDEELVALDGVLLKHRAESRVARQEMTRWAGSEGTYSTELERVDDELVKQRVALERLQERLELELERDKLEAQANEARQQVERLQQKARALESAAQEDRDSKVKQFDQLYTALMRSTLKDVRLARLNSDYEPVLNDAEYREASSTVTRRLMYYVTLLQMSLADPEMPFPRFLLVDTPETAGIDLENLSRAIGKIPEVLAGAKQPAQVILTTGDGKYPPELRQLRKVILTDNDRLLKTRANL
jgi:DNA repair exonuclease SbcCD ATPase subunit